MTTEPERDRMSGTEALMWAMDDGDALRPEMMNVSILDRTPDHGRLLARLEHAVREVPRLARRVVESPLPLTSPGWAHDDHFTLDDHVHWVAAPAPGGHRELLSLIEALDSEPLDRDAPLWRFTVIEGLSDGRAALLQRIHHSVIDGVGGLRLSLAVVDFEREPRHARSDLGPDLGPAISPGWIDSLVDALADSARSSASAGGVAIAGLSNLATHPLEIPEALARGVRLVGSLQQQVIPPPGTGSSLLSARSTDSRFELLTISLEETQRAARHLGGTVNDVYVAVITRGLGRYLDRKGEPAERLALSMPVSLRSRGEVGGNRFAPLRTSVPTRGRAGETHFDAVRAALDRSGAEPALGATDDVARLGALLPPRLVRIVTRAHARTLDFAASNLRGSPVPLYLAGARIEHTYPFGPRVGTALNATVLSYAGDLCIGLNIDPRAIDEPALLVESIRHSIDEISETGRQRSGRRTTATTSAHSE